MGEDIESSTSLHLAAFDRSVNVAGKLLDRGADIEAKGKLGWTPLHDAAFNNSLDVATLLIDRGASTYGIDLSWMK